LLSNVGDAWSGSSSPEAPLINMGQYPFLQNLWGGGSGLMNQQNSGQFNNQMFSNPQQLYGQGEQFLDSLQGPYQQSESATSQIASLQQQLGQQSGRLMNQVDQGGVQAGQFGQSRGDIGRGMVAEGAQNALAQGSGQIMGQDQGIQAQSALGGLSSLQGMFGLGQSPYISQWMPYQNQAGLVGSPISNSGGSAQTGGVGGIGTTAASLFDTYVNR
jgi:hypothetical protein